jgi:chromosome segregation ATPase
MTNALGMLHLAQVQRNQSSGEMELQLLARQLSDYCWEIVENKILPLQGERDFAEDLLVLIKFDRDMQILEIKHAKAWAIDLIEKYLTESSITPEFIDREQMKVEEWRQELTTKSLDLTRQLLEIETRREQLQELETSLQKEKLDLEARWEELERRETSLQQKENNLC